MKTKWTCFWSRGPYDNPDDGQFEVEAGDFPEALKLASSILRGEEEAIVALVRSDVLDDFSP